MYVGFYHYTVFFVLFFVPMVHSFQKSVSDSDILHSYYLTSSLSLPFKPDQDPVSLLLVALMDQALLVSKSAFTKIKHIDLFFYFEL